MDLPINHFKRALKEGKPQIGLWSHLCSHISTEILGQCGLDWMVLDMEHSPNELDTILTQLQALKGSPTMPAVRPPWPLPRTVTVVSPPDSSTQGAGMGCLWLATCSAMPAITRPTSRASPSMLSPKMHTP